MQITDRRRALEILAVLITAVGKFVFMDLLGWRLVYISVAVLAWTAYILVRKRVVEGIFSYWGFRKDNFSRVAKLVAPWAFIVIIVCIAIGLWNHTLNITWHVVPLLLIYPVWGTIQQFLLIGLVAGNLVDLEGQNIRRQLVIFLSALLFGLVHYPSAVLMAGTFLLAIFYCYVYLKARNLYVLGLFHGWLGVIFFYTVVGRDPFLEVFGPYLY